MAKKKYPDPFLRDSGKRKIFCFTYQDPKTGKRKNKSTGFPKGNKEEAREFIRTFIDDLTSGLSDETFKQYADQYFIWETCPRVQRKLQEGKTIGKTHVTKSRQWLERYVFSDEKFSYLKLKEIKSGDILDFRSRLIKKIGLCNTVNKVRGTIRTIFSEAYLRGEIDFNPAQRMGDIEYQKDERDIFEAPEIRRLFQECPGVWGDLPTYLVFYMAAFTGMRQSEILALKWDKILLNRKQLLIHRAWKGRSGDMGLPKWNITRDIPIPESMAFLLRRLKNSDNPDSLVFCYADGSRFGETWWRKNFYEALVKLGMVEKVITSEKITQTKEGWRRKRINYAYQNKRDGKIITPHSLRHTFNTNLLRAGCNETKIQAYMGWQPNRLTRIQKGYTHFTPEDLTDVPELIEEIYLREPCLLESRKDLILSK